MLLWNELKADKFLGLSFNRQKPILNYIADFYCKEKGIVIEIDGASHFTKEAVKYDAERDRQMQVLGLRVLRISDSAVRNDMANVLRELEGFITSPNPSTGGEQLPLEKGAGGIKNALFNEPKYKGLLEGLEISEIKYSKINNEDEDLKRMEAEYFSRKYLLLEQKFDKQNTIGKSTNQITCGPFGSNLLDTMYRDSGILVIRPFNLKNSKIEDENLVYIDEQSLLSNGLKIFKRNTLLFSRVGDIKIGVQTVDKATISPNIIAAEFENEKLAHYLVFFFQTKYGFNQVERQLKIAAQPTISTKIIYDLKFPIISDKLIDAFSNAFYETITLEKKAKQLYTEAENILLQELGFTSPNPSLGGEPASPNPSLGGEPASPNPSLGGEPASPNPSLEGELLHLEKGVGGINIKTFKESFLQTGRLDAEYYQPKYDEIELQIKNYELGFDTVTNLCNVKIQNINPEYETEYKYIELSDIGANGNVTSCTVNIGKELPTRARRLVSENDLIISSIEGSLSSCAIINKEFENAFCSTGFYVINSKIINSETLLLLFKSVVIELMKKGCSGTILTGINNEEFFKIPLPKIDPQIQATISQKIQESFALQAQSKELLEAAKTAVEIAIEQGEAEAMRYLKNYI